MVALCVAFAPLLTHVNAELWFAIGCLSFAAIAFCLMIASIVNAPGRRFWAGGLFFAAMLFAIGNIVVFAVTMSIDAFAIFDLRYLILAGFVRPGLTIATMAAIAWISRKLNWLGILGFTIWVVSVGLSHLWVIAVCSASV